jgi:peroxiredoxin
MTYHKKYMSRPDTSAHVTKCYFKKSKAKLPFSSLFQMKYYDKGEHTGTALFTGNELVSFSLKDSTGLNIRMDKWKEEIESGSDNYDLFGPFTNKDSKPLPKKSSFRDSSFRAVLLGQEKVGGVDCYHIETREGVRMKDFDAQLPDFVSHYWISTADYLPLQISQTFTMIMNKDTMVQYDLMTIDHYKLNEPFDDANISLSVVPSYIRMKDYTPYKSPEPLPIDTIAPGWSFPSLTDEEVSLESLKGKLVLVDFFYKSCFPCMQALPALQSLHEKYKDKGLAVVGLDPYDGKEDNLADFLAKRDVSYTILYASKEIAKAYRVSGYPTMFLISKDGMILYVQVGYGEGTEAKLEEIIGKNL